MGKNRKIGNNGGTGSSGDNVPQSKLVTNNNKRLDNILKKYGKQLDETGKSNLKKLVDYCNNNELEVLTTRLTSRTRILGVGHALISIKNPELDIVYNFERRTLNSPPDYLHSTFHNPVRMLDNVEKSIKTIKSELKPSFTKNVKKVQFAYRPGAWGYFNELDSKSIHLCPELETGSSKFNRQVDRTIVHEMAHNYEHNKYGMTGAIKKFANMENYPCTYASTEYTGGIRPESFATTVEQVYTHKLRGDALMKDGSHASNYDSWAKEWSDLVSEAERIIGK